jgi:hypothetical protein
MSTTPVIKHTAPPNKDTSSSDQERKNETTSSNKFSKFMRLLRGSQMPGLKSSDVYKVVKIIEQENLPNSLSNMSKNVFLKKVEWIIEHNILKRDPFCSFVSKNFKTRKTVTTISNIFTIILRMTNCAVEFVTSRLCRECLLSII